MSNDDQDAVALDGAALEGWLATAAPDRVWWMGTPPPCFFNAGGIAGQRNKEADAVLKWAQDAARWVVQKHGGGSVGVSRAGAGRLRTARLRTAPGELDCGPRGHRVHVPDRDGARVRTAPLAWVRVQVLGQPGADGDLDGVVVAFVECPGLYEDTPGVGQPVESVQDYSRPDRWDDRG